jgi:hypothetical protein
MSDMKRREFITLFGGAAAAWSVAAHAQQTERVRRIDVLTFSAESDQEGQSSVAAFREELRKLGWMEGRNSEIDIRWAAADLELMKRFAKELVTVNDMPGVESLVTTEAREPSSGLVVIPDAFTVRHRAEITALAARYHVPAVYWSRSFAEVGGLISYGPYIVDEYRRAASYADRILKGSKPSELPVQAPVKFELVVNLKTAKALGLDVPPSLLARADEVIE